MEDMVIEEEALKFTKRSMIIINHMSKHLKVVNREVLSGNLNHPNTLKRLLPHNRLNLPRKFQIRL